MRNHPATRRRYRAIVSALALAAGASGPAGAGSMSLRTVALSGEPAPGTAASFLDLSYVVIDANGHAAIHAGLTGNSECDRPV